MWLALIASAHGYTLGDADWTWLEPPVAVGFSLVPDAALPPTADGALAAAARTWNVEGAAAVTVEIGGPNEIALGDLAEGTGSVAITAADGDVTACEITLASSASWSTDSPTPEGSVDLERALLRSIGACVGLGPSDVPGAVMSAEGAPDRHLTEDDAAGLQAIYGPAELSLVKYGHAVLYDEKEPADGICCAGVGEPVIFIARVGNDGNAGAWGLTGTVELVSSTVAAELLVSAWTEPIDIAAGANGSMGFELAVTEACEGPKRAELLLHVTDARGDTWDIPYEFPLQCGVDEPPDDEGWDDDRGCGCGTSAPPSGALGLLAVGALWKGRRRIRAGAPSAGL